MGQQDPYSGTGRGEELGEAGLAGADAGALASGARGQDPYANEGVEPRDLEGTTGGALGGVGGRGQDPYAQQGLSGQNASELDGTTAGGLGGMSGERGAPQIGGDPESGFTSGLGQDPGLTGAGGMSGAGGNLGEGQSGLTGGSGSTGERLFHGHHTTLTGERLDPHIGGSGA